VTARVEVVASARRTSVSKWPRQAR
jgi:hypothetical protein